MKKNVVAILILGGVGLILVGYWQLRRNKAASKSVAAAAIVESSYLGGTHRPSGESQFALCLYMAYSAMTLPGERAM